MNSAQGRRVAAEVLNVDGACPMASVARVAAAQAAAAADQAPVAAHGTTELLMMWMLPLQLPWERCFLALWLKQHVSAIC